MLASTTVLLLIFVSGRLISFLSDAAAGELSMDILMLGLLFRLPSIFELVLPLGFFIAVLFTYGRLYVESEMTVLQACGMSNRRLLVYTMIPASCVALFVAFISLWLSPKGAQQTEELYRQQATMTEFEMLAPGRFRVMKQGERVTYAESLSADKRRMYNVFIADGDTVLIAESGEQYINEGSGTRFLHLINGSRYQGVPGEHNFQELSFETYGVKIADEPVLVKPRKKEAVPTVDLLTSNDPKLIAQLHWRLSLIVVVLVVTLIAVPLSKANNRQGRYAKLLPAILIYLIYLAILISLNRSIEEGELSPIPGLWSVHALFLLIGLWLNYGTSILQSFRRTK